MHAAVDGCERKACCTCARQPDCGTAANAISLSRSALESLTGFSRPALLNRQAEALNFSDMAYSSSNATMGSTRVIRPTGIQQGVKLPASRTQPLSQA